MTTTNGSVRSRRLIGSSFPDRLPRVAHAARVPPMSDRHKVAEYPLVQATLTKRYSERALSFIERNRSRPFFLDFAHAMPHKPLAVSEGNAVKYSCSHIRQNVGRVRPRPTFWRTRLLPKARVFSNKNP